jgi:hypothetical protein
MTTNRREPRRMDQTAAQIATRREALEAAGREEWIRATREGRNAQARTPEELRELGARALARKSGKASGLDEAFMSGRGPAEAVVVTAEAAGPEIEHQDDAAAQRLAGYSKVQFEPTLGERIQSYPGSRVYARIEADWDPARSSGKTVWPSDEILDAGERHKGAYDTKDGKEKLDFFGIDSSGAVVLQGANGKVTSRAHNEFDSARGRPHPDSKATIHWHIDKDSDGFVDHPGSGEFAAGDANPLRQGLPNGTVSDGEVGWHGLDNGRLVFLYPNGTMTNDQIRQKQRNLNREQKLFYRKK